MANCKLCGEGTAGKRRYHRACVIDYLYSKIQSNGLTISDYKLAELYGVKISELKQDFTEDCVGRLKNV